MPRLMIEKKFFLTTLVFSALCIAIDSASAQSWTQTTAPSNYWTAVASSADGAKLIAVATEGTIHEKSIYTSTNGGATWLSNSVPKDYWRAAACSADGSKLFAMASIGTIQRST